MTALEGPFADEDAVVVEGTLEKEEGGEGLPGELRLGGKPNAGAVQEEGTRFDQFHGGRAAVEAEMPGETAVDAGHAAGEVELAVELAGGAEGEGVCLGDHLPEQVRKVVPRDAMRQLEKDALDEEAGLRAIDMAAVFSLGIQFLTERFEGRADEGPLGVGEDGSPSRTHVRGVPSAPLRGRCRWPFAYAQDAARKFAWATR